MTLPEGYVDPFDPEQVAPVLDAALRMAGVGGLADLLARIPGVRISAGTSKGFLRAAVAPSAWIGNEHNLTLTDPVEHQHVVGGVVLSRDQVGRGSLATLTARLLGPVVRDAGGEQEAAIALTAAREAFDGV